MTLSQCPPCLTSDVWPASDHPRDARLCTSAKKRLHTPTNLRSHKPISHQISCHTKVSHTQENASKSRCHTNKSATKSVSYKSVTHTRKCLQVKVSCKQISHQISCHGKVSYTQANQPPTPMQHTEARSPHLQLMGRSRLKSCMHVDFKALMAPAMSTAASTKQGSGATKPRRCVGEGSLTRFHHAPAPRPEAMHNLPFPFRPACSVSPFHTHTTNKCHTHWQR